MACAPKPKAPNGKESELYSALEDLNYTRDKALEIYKKIYEDEFQDFLAGSAVVDENGEPTIHFVGFNDRIPVIVNFNKKLIPNSDISEFAKVFPKSIKYLDKHVITKQRIAQLKNVEEVNRLRNEDGSIRTLGNKQLVDSKLKSLSVKYTKTKFNAFKTKDGWGILARSQNNYQTVTKGNILEDQEVLTEKEFAKQIETLQNNFQKAGISSYTIEQRLKKGDYGKVLGKADPQYISLLEEKVINSKDFVVVLDKTLKLRDKPFHEFAHILLTTLGANDPLVKQGIKQLTKEDYILADITNPGLSGQARDFEALANKIGQEGVKITKSPENFWQRWVNRFIRAISKFFGINRNAAQDLARDMWDGTISNLQNAGPELITRYSREAKRRFAQLKEGLIEIAESKITLIKKDLINDPTSEALLAQLEREKNLIENATEIWGLAEYIIDVRDASLDARNKLSSWLESPDSEKVSHMSDIMTIQEFMTGHSALDDLKVLLSTEKFEDKAGIPKEGFEMMDILTDALNNRDWILSEWKRVGAPAVANIIYPKVNPNVSKGIQEVVDNVQKHLDEYISTEGKSPYYHHTLNKKSRDYQRLEKAYNKGGLTKYEWDVARMELAINQLNNFLPTKQLFINQLTEAFEDISKASLALDPAIYSNNQSIQMVVRIIKDSIYKADQETVDLQPRLGKLVTTWANKSKRLEIKPEVFNEGIYEIINVPHWNPETEEYEKLPVKSFVQPFLIDKLYKNRQEMYELIHNNYRKKWFKNPVTGKNRTNGEMNAKDNAPTTAEWEEFTKGKGKEDYKAYRRAQAAWYRKHMEPKPGAEKIGQAKLDELDKVNEEIKAEEATRKDTKKLNSLMFRKSEILEWLNRNYPLVWGNIMGERMYKGALAQPKKSIYRNPKYDKIMANSAMKEYYEGLLKIYWEEGQSIVPINRIESMIKNPWDDFSYMAPAQRKETYERLKEQGLFSASAEFFRDQVQMRTTDQVYGPINELGNTNKSIPLWYTTLEHADDISADLPRTVLDFVHMAKQFKAKNEVVKLAQVTQELLNQREVLEVDAQGIAKLSSMAKKLFNKDKEVSTKETGGRQAQHFQEFVDTQLHGISKKRESIFAGVKYKGPFTGKTRSLEMEKTKVAGAIAKYTGLNLLALNVNQAFAQVILDNIYGFSEATAGEFFNKSDFIYGKGQYSYHLPDYLVDFNRRYPESKLGQWIEVMDPIQGEVSSNLGATLTGDMVTKAIRTNTLMFLQRGAAHEKMISQSISIAAHVKVYDKDGHPIMIKEGLRKGKQMNMWEAYQRGKDGKMRFNLNPESKKFIDVFDENGKLIDWTNLRNIGHSINKKTVAISNMMDQAALKKQWYGMLVMIFRNWMWGGWRRRYGRSGYSGGWYVDHEAGNFTQATYATFKNLILQVEQTPWKRYGLMSKTEQANIKRVNVEIISLMTTMIIHSLLKPDDDDPKSLPDTWWENFLLYQSRRLQTELLAWVWIPEGYKLVRSPTAGVRLVENWTKFLYQFLFVWNEDNRYYKRKVGTIPKGTNKSWVYFKRSLPLLYGFEKSQNPQQAYKWFQKKF